MSVNGEALYDEQLGNGTSAFSAGKVGKPVILGLDDITMNLKRVQTILGDIYDLKLARTPAVAMKILQSTTVDLMLIDSSMPEMTGFEFVERARAAIPALSKIPVFFSTSHLTPWFLEECAKANAVGHLIKPETPDCLQAKIADALKKRKRMMHKYSNLMQ